MYSATKFEKLRPLKDNILVTEMAFTERISHGGIVLPSDDMKNSGIRPRWGKVYAVGPEQKDIEVGQYILVSHGRWTRGIKVNDGEKDHIVRKVDTKDILLVSDEFIEDQTIGDREI